MLVHVFGAYFGLMVSFVLQRNGSKPENKGSVGYSTDLFAAIGKLILIYNWLNDRRALKCKFIIIQERYFCGYFGQVSTPA